MLPPNASDAISKYFKLVHCCFPILDRGDMRKKCYELARTKVVVDAADSGLAKLAAALGLVALDANIIPQAQQAADATYLYRISRLCIPFADGVYSIPGHVQALLISVLADVSSSRWSQAWSNIGLASRVVLDTIGGKQSLDRYETAAFQACFILDTVIAFRLGRRPQMNRSDLPALLIEDGHEEWEPLASESTSMSSAEPGFVISTFNRQTELFAIVNDCLHGRSCAALIEEAGHISQNYRFDVTGDSHLMPHQLALQCIHFAVEAHLQNKQSASNASGLPGFSRASGILARIESPLSGILATVVLDAVRENMPSMHGGPNKRYRTVSQGDDLHLWPADPFTPSAFHSSAAEPSGQAHGQFFPPHEQTLSSARHPDLVNLAPRDSFAYNSSAPVTSPSFQGDEIDALFREMAQLDTTEWAHGRAQGLGFADEMTLEAFCSDPERVFTGGRGFQQQPMLTSQPSFDYLSHSQQSSSGLNLDNYDIPS
jgi:hypothetical protein